MGRHLIICVALAIGFGACNGKPRAPEPGPNPGDEQRITGREQIGWDQQAADRVELGTYRYAMYVDGSRVVLANVTCANDPGAAGYACQARLPPLSAGVHTLELATFIDQAGAIAESARSQPIRVNVTASTAGAGASSNQISAIADGPAAAEPSPRSGRLSAGVRFRVDRLANGVEDPTDTAFAPDGRLFVAERAGRVRILHGSRVTTALSLDDVSTHGENGLLALAIDPQFDRSRFIYVVYTTASRTGGPAFQIARFREVNDTLAERAILIADIAAAPARAAAALRFGPDGKLYVAFDDGGERDRTGDLASFNGKVLRLNADGSTPDDQPMRSPVFAYGFEKPRGLDWDPDSGRLWMTGEDAGGVSRVRAVDAGEIRSAGRMKGGDVPLKTRTAGAIRFYRGDLVPELRGDLLMISDRSAIVRVRPGASDASRLDAVARLFETDQSIDTLAIDASGQIVVTVGGELVRLVPDR